jgi:hypothetical protein
VDGLAVAGGQVDLSVGRIAALGQNRVPLPIWPSADQEP